MSKRLSLAAILVVWAFAASAGGAVAEDMNNIKRMDLNQTPSTSADEAFAASMATMMRGMHMKPTGKPDKDFVLMMMPHHQGAVDMAKVELKYGTDPELKQLASDIVAAQEKEIAQMKAWLEKNGR